MNTLLIANRGEIALRVMRTARRLGWRTVAIHTDLDAGAPHTREADRVVRVESYLDVDAVVAAARESGAGYVHPGYGFLSERAPFARALAEAGITLVGPSADVMDAMGRKDAARDVAVAAGVPVVPSYSLTGPDAVDPATFSYPVLVKAAAGGGGKGMRVVRSAGDYDEAFAAAQREARSSFGDDTILVEKYVESGRHIEVQVMGDTHGTVLHFFERDCSTQRRHQKVLEEAPATDLPAKLRDKIGERCVDACKRIGYRGVGTFEFLYENGEFFFIEMNTRIQVEHPVTEMVTGLDLVQEQIRVAAGEKLPYRQKDIQFRGHAIECRINAEDPYRFTPSPGKITSYHPPGGPGIRVDSHVYQGYSVPPNYDSMVGKVIAFGATRAQALARMRIALSEMVVEGIQTNIPLHREMINDTLFMRGGVSIHYLEQKLAQEQKKKK
jgi:acetyl-CoA carboxylase biotin carboxylase subunit